MQHDPDLWTTPLASSSLSRFAIMAKSTSTYSPSPAFKQIRDSGIDFDADANKLITALPDWKQTLWERITGAGVRYGVFSSTTVDDKGWLIVGENQEYRKMLDWLVCMTLLLLIVSCSYRRASPE